MKHLEIYIFAKALDWNSDDSNNFLVDLLPHRKEVDTTLATPDALLATILNSETPAKHKKISAFYYNKGQSPFKKFGFLKYFCGAGLHPKCLFNTKAVRKYFANFSAKHLDYKKNFSFASIPYNKLPKFDYTQTSNALEGLQVMLEESKIKYYISDFENTLTQTIKNAQDAINSGATFLFLCIDSQDSLSNIGREIEKFTEALKRDEKDFDITFISDVYTPHIETKRNLVNTLKALNLKFGKDYISLSDSKTMRIWYLNNSAKNIIRKAFANESGHFITDEEKKSYGINFEIPILGDDIFLMNAGFVISPNELESDANLCLHSPNDSSVLCLSSKALTVSHIKEFHEIIKRDIYSMQAQPQC